MHRDTHTTLSVADAAFTLPLARLPQWGMLATALGCGLAGGVFFAFSAFIMPALHRLAPAQGIAAMQSINVKAVTPVFMTSIFGTALACVVLAIWAARSWDQRPAPWVLAGAVVYLLGAIVVTAAANVPMNDALATLHPHAADAASRWDTYVTRWTAWNHVRAVSSLTASALFAIALRLS